MADPTEQLDFGAAADRLSQVPFKEAKALEGGLDFGAAADRLATSGARAALKDTTTVNPDQAIEKRRLAEQAGLPRTAVEGREDAVQSFLDDEAVEGRLKGAPATSRFLSDHENARVASDDIDTLAGLERQWLEEVNNDGIQALITSMPGVARGLVTTGEVSENVARGLGARALELISSAVRLHATVTAASIGADPGAFEEELDLARTLKTGADLLNYVPGTSWEDFKDHPLDNFIPFALEQGIISIPDMALVMASLPAYVLARTGELGQARAENDARANATIGDFVTAAPAAP